MKITLVNNSQLQLLNGTAFLISNLSVVGKETEIGRKYISHLKSAVEKSELHLQNKWKLKVSFTLPEVPTNILDIKICGPLLEILHALTDGHLKLVFRADIIRHNRVVYQSPPEGIAVDVKSENEVFAKISGVIETPGGWLSLEHMTGTTTIFLVSDSDWFMDFGSPKHSSIVLKRALDKALYPDFYLVSQNGEWTIPCHRAVLAGNSEELDTVIRRETEVNKNSKLELKREGNGQVGIPISEEGVRAFLEFLYYNHCRRAVKSSFIAFELLSLGHQYRISSMESAMKEVIMEKSAGRLDVDVALEIFVHFHSSEGYDELKKKVVKVLKLKITQLQQSQLYKEFYKSEASRHLFEFTLQQTI